MSFGSSLSLLRSLSGLSSSEEAEKLRREEEETKFRKEKLALELLLASSTGATALGVLRSVFGDKIPKHLEQFAVGLHKADAYKIAPKDVSSDLAKVLAEHGQSKVPEQHARLARKLGLSDAWEFSLQELLRC